MAAGLAASAADARPTLHRTDLPAPFDRWNVAVTTDPSHAQVLNVEFDSAILGLRARNRVWIPDSYLSSDEPHPVVYALHGTLGSPNAPLTLYLPELLPEREEPAGSPSTFGLDETLDRQRFLVVAPDTGKPWCHTCNWVDGVGGQGVAAESYLNHELQPLVELLFHVRTDRGGRGIIGHSMGGGGALIQGFRHPDRYAFVGSSSGTMTVRDDLISHIGARWIMWNRHQGFGPALTHEIHLRNINLLDLTENVAGLDMDIIAVIGDGCLEDIVAVLDPGQTAPGSCADLDLTGDVNQWAQEVYQRYLNNDVIAPRLIAAGVPLTYIQREGPHSISTSTYRRYFIDRANAIFDRAVESPATFSYKATDRSISVWGWDVTVDRPNMEFLHLDGRTDGRSITLGGTGHVRVTTPPAFEPGRAYEVKLTRARWAAGSDVVVADADGRLSIAARLAPGRLLDERELLVDAGLFPFPRTRLEVVDPDPGIQRS